MAKENGEIITPVPKKTTTKKRKRKKTNVDKKNVVNKSIAKLLPKQGTITPHSSLPQLDIKSVVEPHLKCAYCDKVIDNIASAIRGDEDKYYHFDCMLEKLAKEETLLDGEKISYIGRGTFAIISKNDEGKLLFRKTIEVEKAEVFNQMKKYVEGIKE
jgi:hypothetical protein